MWKSILSVALMSFVLLVAATSRSDSAATTGLPDPTLPEPTLEAPVMPTSGSANAQRDPFKSFDIGGAAAAWTYEELKPEEQDIADRGTEVTGWNTIHNRYASAVREQGLKGRARAAARHLGMDDLSHAGVVP